MIKSIKFEKIKNGSKFKGTIKGIYYWDNRGVGGFFYIVLFDKSRNKTLYIPIKHNELYDIYLAYGDKFEKGRRLYIEVSRNENERGRPYHYKVKVDNELLILK